MGQDQALQRPPGSPSQGPFRGAVVFLQALVAAEPDGLRAWLATRRLDVDAVAWLHAQGLAPYAFHRLREVGLVESLAPAARDELRQAYYRSSADAVIHDDELRRVLRALAAASIVPVLFKGAALAHTAYASSACRPMGDLDLWVTDEEMGRAQLALERLGYCQHAKSARPAALQAQRRGEVQLVGRAAGSGLVELHWGVFAGEWLERAAAVDEAAVRARCLLLDVLGCPACALAPEDAVIQLAAHLAINHQFAYPWVRGLLDIVMTARWRSMDWDVVAARASEWRIATVVWLVHYLAANLLGLEEGAAALEHLRPSSLRRWLLSLLVNTRSLLEMRNLTRGPLRLALQLLLVDRPRDAARLFWRALWPEDGWLAARYGRRDMRTRCRHLLGALRGQI
jgi:hypothetical protein